VYNKTNNIFSEIAYGGRRKNILSKAVEPSDFCYGKIYRVKEEFRLRFESAKDKILPSKFYIEEVLSSFEGVWSEVIAFDGIKYVNFAS
jgi:hypothetical protein